jgi:hypothetical protein
MRKLLPAVLIVALAGCGSSSTPKHTATTSTRPATRTSTVAAAAPAPGLSAAENPGSASFPSAARTTLTALAKSAKAIGQLGPATGTFTPGMQRVAFGVLSPGGEFVYGPTALYIAKTPTGPVSGPYLAPADPFAVAAPYRSTQNAGPSGVQAIYATEVPVAAPGTYPILALTHDTSGQVIAAPGEIAVAASTPIPGVGEKPPQIATDTLATDHGDIALVTTRNPPDDMHAVSLNQVLGKKPVALLFSTPELCTSRVCGPVTDIAVQLEHEFAGKVIFIHEEVYADNQPTKGLRAQMKAFHLETDPWLFTINKQGVIAARLEGAFGVNAFRKAVEAALA